MPDTVTRMKCKTFTMKAPPGRSATPLRGVRLAFVAAASLLVASCQNLSELMGDSSIRPSNNPVIAENVRSGKLARVGEAQHPKILATYGGEYSNPKLERMVAGIVGKLVTVSDNPSQVYQITILKQRGGWAGQVVELNLAEGLTEADIPPADLPVHQPVAAAAPVLELPALAPVKTTAAAPGWLH